MSKQKIRRFNKFRRESRLVNWCINDSLGLSCEYFLFGGMRGFYQFEERYPSKRKLTLDSHLW